MSDMARDPGRVCVRTQSIAPLSNRTATVTGSEVDCTGCASAVFVGVDVGAIADATAAKYFTFTVTQADTTGGSFSAADSSQYDAVSPTGSSTEWDLVINATGEASTIYGFNFHLDPSYQFIKVVGTATGSTPDVDFGAFVEFEKETKPATGA